MAEINLETTEHFASDSPIQHGFEVFVEAVRSDRKLVQQQDFDIEEELIAGTRLEWLCRHLSLPALHEIETFAAFIYKEDSINIVSESMFKEDTEELRETIHTQLFKIGQKVEASNKK